jgi:hypothetical protein
MMIVRGGRANEIAAMEKHGADMSHDSGELPKPLCALRGTVQRVSVDRWPEWRREGRDALLRLCVWPRP